MDTVNLRQTIDEREARAILGIPEEADLTDEMLKKQYRKLALIYHPDKNPGVDSSQFQRINTAYTYLLDDSGGIDDEEGASGAESYGHLLFAFLKKFNQVSLNDIQYKIFYMIVNKISGACRERVLNILEQLDKTLLIKIYEIFKEHQEIFHFSTALLDEIGEIVRRKIEQTESIILNPFLKDLLDCQLYKMTVQGNKYIIPLWHTELVYDHCGNDLHILCNPILTDNIYIDAKNNIHVKIECGIGEIWKSVILNGNYTIWLTEDHSVSIPGKSIALDTGAQSFYFSGKGIPRMDTQNIYNVSVRGDIVVYLTLV